MEEDGVGCKRNAQCDGSRSHESSLQLGKQCFNLGFTSFDLANFAHARITFGIQCTR